MEDLTDELCRSALSYNLIELMDRKGFSQKTLAEYTGLGKGTIYNYINKKATPSLTALRKIAYALGCTVSELVE
jgi:transcriptional regulator with XRE-family HTH domain